MPKRMHKCFDLRQACDAQRYERCQFCHEQQGIMYVQHQTQGCRTMTWRPHCFHNLCRLRSHASLTSCASKVVCSPMRRCSGSLRSSKRCARTSRQRGGVTCQAEQPVATKLSMDVGGRQVNSGTSSTYQ